MSIALTSSAVDDVTDRKTARSITHRGDGGFDVPRHALILLEQTFDNQWKTLWIQRIFDDQAVLS